MFVALHIILLFPISMFAILVGYLILLTLAATRAEKTTLLTNPNPTHRFLLLIPAHNEERLLPSLLNSLSQLDYPQHLFEIHVVADNCTDQTADIARQGGATPHERNDTSQLGKGYALEWLLHRLWEAQIHHDAIIILDADTIVSKNFLKVMDARMSRGERVIQAYYAVRDPGSSWAVSIRYIALAAIHFLRPLGRMVLGGSAGLKGNGMVFAASIMKAHTWTAHLTEDIEFHMQLVLDGERVMFAPDAIVEAEMPTTLSGSQTQNVRWERGRVEMARRYIPSLWREARKALSVRQFKKAYLLVDAIAEHLIPPFSIFVALSVLWFLAALFLPGENNPIKTLNLYLSVSVLFGQIVYTFASLWLVKAPRKIYMALFYAPVFVFWKIWLYIRVLLGLDRREWVRTARNEP